MRIRQPHSFCSIFLLIILTFQMIAPALILARLCSSKLISFFFNYTGSPWITMAIGTGIAMASNTVVKSDITRLCHLATEILTVPIPLLSDDHAGH